MYVNPVQNYEFGSLDGTPVEVEATADILALKGRLANEATGTDNSIDAVFCPFGGQVEYFCVELTEAIVTADATNHAVAVKLVDADGSTVTTIATMTLPGISTDVTAANIRASDTSSPTAAQAVAVGARFMAGPAAGVASVFPYTIPAGGRIFVEATVAASNAGGAYFAFCGIRQNGAPSPGAAADSPITLLSA